MISGVCMGVIVFIPFVGEVNKDVNPVFGKPKDKNFGTRIYGEDPCKNEDYNKNSIE